jgi:hypothetical protein
MSGPSASQAVQQQWGLPYPPGGEPNPEPSAPEYSPPRSYKGRQVARGGACTQVPQHKPRRSGTSSSSGPRSDRYIAPQDLRDNFARIVALAPQRTEIHTAEVQNAYFHVQPRPIAQPPSPNPKELLLRQVNAARGNWKRLLRNLERRLPLYNLRQALEVYFRTGIEGRTPPLGHHATAALGNFFDAASEEQTRSRTPGVFARIFGVVTRLLGAGASVTFHIVRGILSNERLRTEAINILSRAAWVRRFVDAALFSLVLRNIPVSTILDAAASWNIL